MRLKTHGDYRIKTEEKKHVACTRMRTHHPCPTAETDAAVPVGMTFPLPSSRRLRTTNKTQQEKQSSVWNWWKARAALEATQPTFQSTGDDNHKEQEVRGITPGGDVSGVGGKYERCSV